MKYSGIVFLVIALVWVINGCSKSPSTPGQDNTIRIKTSMVFENNRGMLSESIFAYVADSSGLTLATAAISIIGTGGIIGTPGTNGTFSILTLGSAPDMFFNAQYAISVTYNAKNYYGVFYNDYGTDVEATGSYVSWPYSAESVSITVQDPAFTNHCYVVAASPFMLAPTGIYGSGSGNYTIGAVITHNIPVTFTGQAGISGNVIFQDTHYLTVAK